VTDSPLWNRDTWDGSPTPLLLLHTPSALTGGWGAGWDVVAPLGALLCLLLRWVQIHHLPPTAVGTDLWRLLSLGGANAIGLQERCAASLEQGRATFPADFPDTAAGREWAAAYVEVQQAERAKQPLGKREGVCADEADWFALLGIDGV
jgi:hypothetical protein